MITTSIPRKLTHGFAFGSLLTLSSAYLGAQTGTSELLAYPAQASITIDGTKDSSYRGSNNNFGFTGTVDDAADLSAELSATWDAAGVYLFIDVTDDVVNVDSGTSDWLDDSIEIAFDPNNSDATGSFDGVDDIKIIARLLDDGTSEVVVAGYPAAPSGADTSALDAVVVTTATGYAAEVFVPWAALQIEPMGDWLSGLGIAINDDDGTDLSDPLDGTGDREGVALWGKSYPYVLNFHPDQFGDLTILTPKETIVRSTTETVAIDGIREEAAYGRNGNIADRWVPATSIPEGGATWSITNDDTNLYFFLQVNDASIMAGESVNNWEDDGLELFLDGDNSKSGNFDNVDDVKMSFRLTDLLGGLEVITTSNFPSPPAGTDFSGLETAALITDTGWNLELKIPLSIIKLTPEAGKSFGIGMGILDDDDGDARDGVLTWSSGIGLNFSTHLMGTATFFSLPEAVVEEANTSITVDGDIDDGYSDSAWNMISRAYSPPLQNDCSGYWIGSYDDTNLYLVFDIYDDVVMNDDPDAVWADDALEIFFDPSNDSSGNFDGVEDVKITVASPVDGVVRVVTTSNFPSPPAGTDFTDLEVVWVETTMGWRVEMQVPWATLHTTPMAGAEMAFDVVINDDDDGGARDSVVAWSSLGVPNFETQNYGTVLLGDTLSVSLSQNALAAYPTLSSITLDGAKDSSYRGNSDNFAFTGTVDDAADLSAELSATWDAAGVYLFIDVTDDVVNVDSGTSNWLDDSIEISFDPGNSDAAGSFDGVDDIKFIAQLLDDGSSQITVSGFPAAPSGADTSALDAVVVTTATGYAAEVFVPWAALQIEPMGDWLSGLGIAINDDDGTDLSDPVDGTGDREGVALWGKSNSFSVNFHTDQFGDLTILTPKETIVRSTTETVAIDGIREEAAYGRNGNIADRWVPATSIPEGGATWSITNDDTNLYFFLQVNDASIMAGESVNNWEDDGLELFLDGDNSKSGNFDNVDDVKMSFRLTDLLGGLEVITTSNFPSPPAGTDFSGLETAALITDTGWNLELKIPLSIIKLTPEAGKSFGIGMGILDDDDGDARDGVLTWSSGIGLNFSTHLMGTATFFSLPEAVVEEANTSITVDGDIDDGYSDSAWNMISRAYSPPLQNDCSGYWIGSYDDTNLYLVFDIYDDVVMNDDPDAVWADDALEIFFDPSNDSSGNFDGVEDVKITVASPVDGVVRVVTTSNFPSPPAGTDFTDLEVVWVETTMGWRVEMQVPWATLHTTPMAGAEMAFDVVINDDDDGGARDSVVAWSSLGVPNFETQNYGTVVIGGTPAFSDIIAANKTAENRYQSDWFGSFWENPSSGSWIHRGGLKWLYTGAVTTDTAMWLYSSSLAAWCYTGSSLFPYVYVGGTGWHYYYESAEGAGYVYDFTGATWSMVP